MAHDWRNPERVIPWKPRQRFLVTDSGRAAIARYHDAVHVAQSSAEPRAELDRAKVAWAESLGLRPPDGIVLDDLAAGRDSLSALKETLEACGLTLRDARGALDRLKAAALVEPVGEPARDSV